MMMRVPRNMPYKCTSERGKNWKDPIERAYRRGVAQAIAVMEYDCPFCKDCASMMRFAAEVAQDIRTKRRNADYLIDEVVARVVKKYGARP